MSVLAIAEEPETLFRAFRVVEIVQRSAKDLTDELLGDGVRWFTKRIGRFVTRIATTLQQSR